MSTAYRDSRVLPALLRRFLGTGATRLGVVLALVGSAAGCSGAGVDTPPESTAQTVAALSAEDGLADAYGVFKGLFTSNDQDQNFVIGFGFHPGLSTSKIVANGNPVNGHVTLNFAANPNGVDAAGTVTATLRGPTTTLFDLYFVKNAPGLGTVKPESFDSIIKVGSFVPTPGVPNQQTLKATGGIAPFPTNGVNFDLDMVVVTLKGQSPTTNVIASGARTLFEKRFFRERAGSTLDPVTGTLANFVETNDPLVQRGAQLFVNESFNGNGRKCATCHPLANNQTIDPAFVATLPSSDPLFHFPAGLEDPNMLQQALIRENVDGFEQPTLKFVERSVPHTLSMSASVGEVGTGLGQSNLFDDSGGLNATGPTDGPPPDQRTGWGGDGAPGRGTLNEFAFGAIIQHYTLSLQRVPGQDFRIPTQAELEALEAFQMFNGRQKTPNSTAFTLADPFAETGRQDIFNAGCNVCHLDLAGTTAQNASLNTGVEQLPIAFRTGANMPKDGGFGANLVDGSPGSIAAGFGNGDFNIPPLYEMADTPPFFHNGAISNVEAAVAFYQSPQFLGSSGARFFTPFLTANSIQTIGGFLRTVNALVNIAQVRKRAIYLQNNATQGGTTIMQLAIKDTQDAITDLNISNLNGTATSHAVIALINVKAIFQNTLPFANQEPSTEMIQVLTWLGLAKNDLLATNPNNDF
jgi:hypothetical protein